MKTKFGKLITLFVACAMAFSAVACGKNQGSFDEIDENYEWLDASITDTSDLSSYSGGTSLNLVGWNTTQTGGALKKESSQDVVSPEIKRITGVSVSDESFDNGGMVASERFKQLLVTRSLPDFMYGTGGLSVVDSSYLYDLTDLIEKYCPTIMKRVPEYVWEYCKVDGRIYGIPYMLFSNSMSSLDPEAANLSEGMSTVLFDSDNDYYPYVLVRDDVLKEAYPEAKTQDELDEYFAEHGEFTEDVLFDVEITSAEQFRNEFLPKIYNVLQSNDYYVDASGRRVSTMVLHTGYDYDTWDFMGVLIPKLLGGAGNHYNTHFNYWDVSTQKIEMMFEQDFYKNEVYEWAKLLSDGKYVSTDGFDSTHTTVMGDLNSGRYAIAYGSNTSPAGNKAVYSSSDKTTKTVKYRKVYLKIELNKEHFEYWENATATPETISFFKSKINEANLPQILRWLDYQCSRLADKLYAWGPRSAGLFTEDENGIRKFKNEELANQMVYATSAIGDQVQRYNLANGTLRTPQPTFPFMYMNASIYHPKCTYNLSKMEGISSKYFSPSYVCPKTATPLIKQASIHMGWSNDQCAGVEELWAKRPGIELKLEQLLKAGTSQAAYDKAFSGLMTTLQQSGWTKEYFNGVYTNAFLSANADVLSGFYKNA